MTTLNTYEQNASRVKFVNGTKVIAFQLPSGLWATQAFKTNGKRDLYGYQVFATQSEAYNWMQWAY